MAVRLALGAGRHAHHPPAADREPAARSGRRRLRSAVLAVDRGSPAVVLPGGTGAPARHLASTARRSRSCRDVVRRAASCSASCRRCRRRAPSRRRASNRPRPDVRQPRRHAAAAHARRRQVAVAIVLLCRRVAPGRRAWQRARPPIPASAPATAWSPRSNWPDAGFAPTTPALLARRSAGWPASVQCGGLARTLPPAAPSRRGFRIEGYQPQARRRYASCRSMSSRRPTSRRCRSRCWPAAPSTPTTARGTHPSTWSTICSPNPVLPAATLSASV